MSEKIETYKKSQYAYWIYGMFSVIILFLIFNYDRDTFIYPAILLVLIAVIFYKLTIRITNEEITAYFGFGCFKRKMKLSEIDLASIQKINVRWWTGIGIRYTSQGWLYNVKLGEALKMVSKDKKKVFFVGTDEFHSIKQILLDQIHDTLN